MTDPIHSTGRGGAGNIGPDPNTYVPGDIVREGTYAESGQPEYSSGRGGAGNMASPLHGAQAANQSTEMVPETAMRPGEGHDNFHTGRGGAGNEHRAKYGGHSSAKEEQHEHQHHNHEGKGAIGGLVEKAKHLIGADKEQK